MALAAVIGNRNAPQAAEPSLWKINAVVLLVLGYLGLVVAMSAVAARFM